MSQFSHLCSTPNYSDTSQLAAGLFISIQLGTNINYDDKVCTKSKVHGYTENGSNWWNNFDYGSTENDGNCRIILNYENPDYNKIIERVKQLTNEGKTNTQEYRDLVDTLANATSISNIVNDAEYITSTGQRIKITPEMWAKWINDPNSRIDPNTKIVVKNAKTIGNVSSALNVLAVGLSIVDDSGNYKKNQANGVINPAPATTSTLLSLGASYTTGVAITAACAAITGGACAVVVVVGSLVVGVATQIGAEYFFTKVLTKDNIQKIVDDFQATIPKTDKQSIDWIIGLCNALGGGPSCGNNPYNY